MQNKKTNFILDSWLTDILKREVYKFIVDDPLIKRVRNEKSSKYLLLQTLQKRPVFIYAKVPTAALDYVRFLEELGFYLVDTNIVFEKPVSSLNKMVGNCEVRFVLPNDEAQVVEVAKNSFVYSRFHLDPAFSIETANMIKAEWARSYFIGRRGEAMIVALIDETIVGFLQLLKSNDGILTIDLIAVDSNNQRQGIASDMVRYAENHCQDVRQIRVGTQLANIPSIRLYEEMGFKVLETNYVFHYHNR